MSYRVLPSFGGDPRSVAEVVNQAMNGKTNNIGSVTLAALSATTTTLSDARIGADSVIVLMPKTSNAAAWMNMVYVSSRTNGSATLSHSANTAVDRSYAYLVVG